MPALGDGKREKPNDKNEGTISLSHALSLSKTKRAERETDGVFWVVRFEQESFPRFLK